MIRITAFLSAGELSARDSFCCDPAKTAVAANITGNATINDKILVFHIIKLSSSLELFYQKFNSIQDLLAYQ
jgi:hypothetical protein